MTMSIADIEAHLQAEGEAVVAALSLDLPVELRTDLTSSSDPPTNLYILSLVIGKKDIVSFTYKPSFTSIGNNPFKDYLNAIEVGVADDAAFMFEVRQALTSDRLEPFLIEFGVA